jgi:hypothetical protein
MKLWTQHFLPPARKEKEASKSSSSASDDGQSQDECANDDGTIPGNIS